LFTATAYYYYILVIGILGVAMCFVTLYFPYSHEPGHEEAGEGNQLENIDEQNHLEEEDHPLIGHSRGNETTSCESNKLC